MLVSRSVHFHRESIVTQAARQVRLDEDVAAVEVAMANAHFHHVGFVDFRVKVR